jgi:predicted transglutaminase-like cysteine proteinase
VTDAAPALDGVALIPRHPPLAHVAFCYRYTGQCDVAPDSRRPGMTEAEMLAEVEGVNRSVNARIRPRNDTPGEDRWDINVTAGDCEDYALTKRADLLALGWPSNTMRLAIVQHGRQYHAVLLVQVGNEELVLDNLIPEVVLLQQIQYRILMLQDRNDPRAWWDAG